MDLVIALTYRHPEGWPYGFGTLRRAGDRQGCGFRPDGIGAGMFVDPAGNPRALIVSNYL